MLALEDKLTDHHKFMLRIIRKDIAKTEALIAELDLEIAQQLEPYAKEITLLQEVPGIGKLSAAALISEIGMDMEVFPSERHISSWTGVSPGNNESAGKKKVPGPPTETKE